MNNVSTQSGTQPHARQGFFILLACLVVIFGSLFARSFIANRVIFSNDGPLGVIGSKSNAMPSGYFGTWSDLNWVGTESVSASPNFSIAVATLLQPLGYAKFMVPIAMMLLGISAWLFFRQLNLLPVACILGGLAAALNSEFFSTACWGVVAQPVCFAANFFALAAVANNSGRHFWIRAMLAGFAVGWGVMEGFDIGAIFSLFTAAYVVFQTWNVEGERPPAGRLGLGVARVAVVAAFAAFIATQTLSTLIGTQIKGVVGTQQDEETKKARWDEATRWSMPKIEVFQIFVPGVFGYRMDTEGGGAYWGSIGEDPDVPALRDGLSSANPETQQQAAAALKGHLLRFSGGGFYAGVLVVLVAFWAFCQSFRTTGSPFSVMQRRSVWFWSAVATISLPLAFGRYAPLFYHLFYALPYASTIRNPAKFLHIFNWALVILFAYGLHGITTLFLQNPVTRMPAVTEQFKSWWARAPRFDRNWLGGCFCAVGAAVLGWLIYASSRSSLIDYLQKVGFVQGGPADAGAIATFSIHAVGWFVLFLILCVALLALIFSGQFAGPRSKWGCLLLGLLLAGDLVRANLPWIVYWDYTYKYATNPVIDFLKDKPYEHRAVILPFQLPIEKFGLLQQLYGIEWSQHLFPYYNIQSLDLIMEPREAVENNAYRSVISPHSPSTLMRLWQLTNTRYLLGPAEAAEILNRQFDPIQQRFQLVRRFDLGPKDNVTATSLTDLTAVYEPNGPLGVIDFTGALPRAKLYSDWQVSPDQSATLKELVDPAFDPAKMVLVTESIPAPSPGNSNQSPGTVTILPNYEPKHIELDADVKTPAVLLLNDKYNPKWQVWVDGKPDTILHGNFLMRAVYLQPGQHHIVFRFAVPMKTFYVSLTGVVVAFALLGFLIVSKPEPEQDIEAPTRRKKDREPAKA